MKSKFFFFLLAGCIGLEPIFSEDRPNIVFILADDLGYGDIEAFGGEQCNIDTPHFDRLCAEGMKFTDAHVTDSVCVPSRTSIMTGRYAFRFGKPEQGGPWGFVGLRFPTTQHTLGDMLLLGNCFFNPNVRTPRIVPGRRGCNSVQP